MFGSDPCQGPGAQKMAGYIVEIINWHILNFIYRSFDHCELVRTCSSIQLVQVYVGYPHLYGANACMIKSNV
jgi:hypothetical protein